MTAIPLTSAGIAGFEVSETFTSTEIFNSAVPQPVTEDMAYGQNTDLAALSVVGLDAGVLALARLPDGEDDDGVAALGVLVTPVDPGAGQSGSAPIWRAGNFNPDALVWHESYDTPAKRLAAFNGAPTPTYIILRERL